MSIIVNREMFRSKKLQKGAVKNRGKYLYWVNLWGFGVIITGRKGNHEEENRCRKKGTSKIR